MSYDSGRIASHYAIRRHWLSHDGPGTHDAMFSDIGHNDGPFTYPRTMSDVDSRPDSRLLANPSAGIIKTVLPTAINDGCVAGYENVISNMYLTNTASRPDIHVVSYNITGVRKKCPDSYIKVLSGVVKAP
jgi:hypothetical protein